MYSLNRVQIIGYQTQPVDVRQTPSGTSVVDLNLMVPTRFTADSGEVLTGKSFHTVTLWGALADVAGQFVRPGSQLFIAGRLQTDSWEDEQSGEKRSKTKVVGSEMIMLDPKSGQMPEPIGAKETVSACNRADIIGNVTKDPEVRTTTNGNKVVSIGVASNERWKDKASGEMKERTEFHNVVIWGDMAEEVAQFAQKGSKLFVSGRVQTRAWETQTGSKRTTTEVIAESISLLGVANSMANESIQADSTPRPAPAAATKDQFGEDPAPVAASVPEVNYQSDVKVEDLPF